MAAAAAAVVSPALRKSLCSHHKEVAIAQNEWLCDCSLAGQRSFAPNATHLATEAIFPLSSRVPFFSLDTHVSTIFSMCKKSMISRTSQLIQPASRTYFYNSFLCVFIQNKVLCGRLLSSSSSILAVNAL